MDEPTKSPRLFGFAAMAQTPEGRERVRETARRGGHAAHAAGTAHEFTSEKAREAGRLGGRAVHAKRRAAREASAVSPEKKDSSP